MPQPPPSARPRPSRPGRTHQLGAAAQARVRHRHAALPELRRRGAQDHRRHPGAAGDREDPDPPGAGSAAAAQGSGARGGARLRRLSRAGPVADTRTSTWAAPPSRSRVALRDLAARCRKTRVNPEVEVESALCRSLPAPCKRSITCRISATRGRRHPILALQAAAARSSGLTWALLRAVKTPMLASEFLTTCAPKAHLESTGPTRCIACTSITRQSNSNAMAKKPNIESLASRLDVQAIVLQGPGEGADAGAGDGGG